MEHNKPMKIVIASSGRRAHYIGWFQEALRAQGLDGEVIAMEFRTTSPGFGHADRAVATPAYNSPEYITMVREWFTNEQPDLFLCMNNYELQALSDNLAEELHELDGAYGVLSASAQAIVIDKYRTAETLREHGIPTPDTYLGTEVDAARADAGPETRFVVKHRFGAGSTGLQITDAADLTEAVETAATTALGHDGHRSQDGKAAVVVQEYLPGPEYGADGVFSADGRSQLLGVVARRKDTMRGGDTDLATTVSPEPFQQALQQIGNLLSPTGPVDVDFRQSATGELLVIDINPRMGGGYPFCHSAGADMPSVLIRSAAGLDHIPELLDYELGVTTVRGEQFTVVRKETTDAVAASAVSTQA